MNAEIRYLIPTIDKSSAYRVADILYNEGVWKKNLPKLIKPNEELLEDGQTFKDMDTAIKLLLNNYDKRNRILVIGDELVDSVAAVVIFVKILRTYGFDVDYKVVRQDAVNTTVVIDSTNCDYLNENYALVVGVGEISRVKLYSKAQKKAKKRNVDIVIADAPLLSLDPTKKDKASLVEAKTKLVDGRIILYPKCKAYLNPKDPENKYRNKELSKAGVAYKMMERLIQARKWDISDLKECEKYVGLGMIAAEKNIFCRYTQSYENRYFYELTKVALERPNAIWFMALNEIKRVKNWDRETIRSGLINPLLLTSIKMNEFDVIAYLNEKTVAEARALSYQILSAYEVRKSNLAQFQNELRGLYKENDKFDEWLFAKYPYKNQYEYTTLVDANNKNAEKYNKVCCVNLTTPIGKNVVVFSTPKEINNGNFLGYLLTQYGVVKRRGRAIAVAVEKNRIKTLLTEVNVLVKRQEENIFKTVYDIEFEEMNENVMEFLSKNGIEITARANKNEIISIVEKTGGASTVVAKRHNKSAALIVWEGLDLKRERCATDRFDIYYKPYGVSKFKKHRIIRVEQLINETR